MVPRKIVRIFFFFSFQLDDRIQKVGSQKESYRSQVYHYHFSKKQNETHEEMICLQFNKAIY